MQTGGKKGADRNMEGEVEGIAPQNMEEIKHDLVVEVQGGRADSSKV